MNRSSLNSATLGQGNKNPWVVMSGSTTFVLSASLHGALHRAQAIAGTFALDGSISGVKHRPVSVSGTLALSVSAGIHHFRPVYVSIAGSFSLSGAVAYTWRTRVIYHAQILQRMSLRPALSVRTIRYRRSQLGASMRLSPVFSYHRYSMKFMRPQTAFSLQGSTHPYRHRLMGSTQTMRLYASSSFGRDLYSGNAPEDRSMFVAFQDRATYVAGSAREYGV